MKKTISILAAFAAFAVFGVTPNTEFQDVPGTDKLGEVLSAGGAVITEADPVWNAQKGGYQPKLVSGTNIKTVNGNSLLGNGNVEVKSGDGLTTNAVLDIIHKTVDGSVRPLPKYLHALDFDDSYPEVAAEYYRSRGDGKTDGGCSSVRDGGFLYRNFDYPFDDRAEFVVKMSAGKDRFASVGVAQVGTNLTEAIVTSGKPSRCYKWLPGATVDGINENGVVCNINVVDGNPQTSGWHTGGDIHPLAAVRWALDNGTSAGMVASNLALRIAFPQGWTQNFHYMIADERETWIVEDGAFVSTGTTYRRPPLTNCGVVDRVLIYPDIVRFVYDPLSPSIGEGMERLHTLLEGASITNVWYTRAYQRETNPPWVSDLAEVIDYTNDIFNAWAAHDKEYFRGQLNGGKPWWQTVHTSIYDITNRVLRIAVQETDDWYTFALPGATGVSPDAVREIVEPMIGAATNALPTKAEVDAKLAEKRDKTDAAVYAFGQTSVISPEFLPITGGDFDWSSYSIDKDFCLLLDARGYIAGGFNQDTGKWFNGADGLKFGGLDPVVGEVPFLVPGRTARSFVHAPDATTSGIAAFDGKGRLKVATAGDIPHDETKFDVRSANGWSITWTTNENDLIGFRIGTADGDNTIEYGYQDGVPENAYFRLKTLYGYRSFEINPDAGNFSWITSDDYGEPVSYTYWLPILEGKEGEYYRHGHLALYANTLEGYGITNAYSKSEIDSMTNNFVRSDTSTVIKGSIMFGDSDFYGIRLQGDSTIVIPSVDSIQIRGTNPHVHSGDIGLGTYFNSVISSTNEIFSSSVNTVMEDRDYAAVSNAAMSAVQPWQISHTNDTFSAEVLAVQIDTNTVAQIGELKQFFDDLPIGTVGTSLGGIILALLGAAAYLKKKTSLLENDGKASNTFATDLLGKQVAKTALMIPLETVEAGTSTITAEDGHAYAVTMTGTVTITMPTTTEGKAAIFQARFSAAAQQSVEFDTDDVVKFDGTDCGIVKAGKDALLSAMWNGETWDLVWKNQA